MNGKELNGRIEAAKALGRLFGKTQPPPPITVFPQNLPDCGRHFIALLNKVAQRTRLLQYGLSDADRRKAAECIGIVGDSIETLDRKDIYLLSHNILLGTMQEAATQ